MSGIRFLFRAFFIGALVLVGPVSALADEDYDKVEHLFATETSIVGEPLRYPGGGRAKVSALIVTMAPGEKTGWHKHGVPLFAYILSGSVTVDYGAAGKRTYGPGASFMEAMDHWHEGINGGNAPVRILAVFMGGEGQANVIRKPGTVKKE